MYDDEILAVASAALGKWRFLYEDPEYLKVKRFLANLDAAGYEIKRSSRD